MSGMTASPARVVLHVGPHKTGSTYIQKKLLEQQAALAAAGVCYPSAGIDVQYGQHAIPAELYRQGHSATLDRLLAADAVGPTLLLSSENFDLLDEGLLQRLAAQLHGRQVEVVYVWRRADERLLSGWQEECKHGSALTWAEYALWHAAQGPASPVLNPLGRLDLYRRALGARLVLLDYRRAEGEPDLACAVIAQAADGLRLTLQPERVNPSAPHELSELRRALNALYRMRHGQLPGNRVRRGLAALKSAAHTQPLQALRTLIRQHARPAQVLGTAVLQALREGVLARHGDAVTGGLDDELAAPPQALPTSDWLLVEGVQADLASLLAASLAECEP